MKRLLTVLLFSLIFSAPAAAEKQSYRDLLYHYDKGGSRDKRLIQKHFGDIGAGIHWANAALAARKAKRLYCPPKKLTLRGDMYFTMFRRRVEKDAALIDTPDTERGRILLAELQKTFPCK